jgi:cell wall-associated NlpC family hydrolase
LEVTCHQFAVPEPAFTRVNAGGNPAMIIRYMCLLTVMLLCLIPASGGAAEAIRDLRELRQDHRAYLDLDGGPTASFMMDPQEQQRRDRDYNDRHFSPWRGDRPGSSLADILFEFEKYERNRGYGSDGRKHGADWVKKLRANAGLKDYFRGGHPAITLRRSSLRALPTQDAHFNSRQQAVSGHPFDNLQATAVMVNTPVFISHTSRDKKWVWAETGYYFGWMRAQDAAALPAGFLQSWETGRYAVIVRDKTPLYDAQGRFLFQVSLGTIFPLAGEGEANVEILVAVAEEDRAVLKKVTVSKDAAAAKPVPMTPAQMARMANELIGEPYGWGGLNGHRDCSAMLRDLFAPFGIWLPRNSTEQALEGGMFIDLSGQPAEQKEIQIVSRGVPYLTLLWRKGHIMLYIGRHNGRPLVFHNLWGISTRPSPDQKGKLIVGHAAITTLHPGRELPGYHKASADLSTNILGMTLLVAPPEGPAPQGR